MNLPEARTALAAAVSTLTGVSCVSHPVPGNLRLGDAYVTAGRRTPGAFLGADDQVLNAYVVLGSDERKADEKVDEWSGPLLRCVEPLYGAAVSVEPQALASEGQGVIFHLVLSATFELSA